MGRYVCIDDDCYGTDREPPYELTEEERRAAEHWEAIEATEGFY